MAGAPAAEDRAGSGAAGEDGAGTPLGDLAGRGFDDASARVFRRSLLGLLFSGLAGLMVMIGLATVLTVRAQDYARWVEHTYEVQSWVRSLEADVERAETARRGYLLVPTGRFRTIYESARDAIPGDLDHIAILTLDNAPQERRVRELRGLTAERARRVAEMMDYAAAGDLAAAVASFQRDRDQPVLDRVRVLEKGMIDEEQRLLKARADAGAAASQGLFAVAVGGGTLLVLLSGVAFVLMRRYTQDLASAQGDLRRLNADLERRVRERTAELSRANEEVQRFAYIVSHDLRSPLVNVMGFTSELEVALGQVREHLLRPGAEPPPPAVRAALETDAPEAIGFIRSSSQKMDGLIRAILKLSREGRRTLAPEPLDMNRLIQDLFDGVRHRLGENHGAAEIEGSLPGLRADRLAVEQIFGNLVDNAVKYLDPSRPGRLRVRGRREGERVVYEVEDNGRGIAEKDHERIFELFRRSGPQNTPGEGIGLAHVRALVYRLDGAISCRSELGRGSVFTLSFPAAASPTSS